MVLPGVDSTPLTVSLAVGLTRVGKSRNCFADGTNVLGVESVGDVSTGGFTLEGAEPLVVNEGIDPPLGIATFGVAFRVFTWGISFSEGVTLEGAEPLVLNVGIDPPLGVATFGAAFRVFT